MPQGLREKLENLPSRPGVYHMLDRGGKVLYIGKAKDLRQRVRSYFASKQERPLTRLLVEQIEDLEVIVTETETEALLLECDQIKTFSPPYNIQFKDQKTYPYLCFTTKERFPRLFKTRSKKHKGIYFGPFTDVRHLNRLIEVVHRLFPLKKCNQKSFPKGFKPCAYFHMGRCLDYCTGGVPQSVIESITEGVKKVLRGQTTELIQKLEERMSSEIMQLHYEKASILKDRIDMLRSLKLKPNALRSPKDNVDVFHYALDDASLVVAVLQVRSGQLSGKRTFEFKNKGLLKDADTGEGNNQDMVDAFSQFALEYYRKNPNEVVSGLVSPFNDDDLGALALGISELFRRREPNFKSLTCSKPTKGRYKRYLSLAGLNANQSFLRVAQEREQENVPKALKSVLGLPRQPRTIESFDIANTSHAHILAGMVRFRSMRPDKANYRTFLIRGTQAQNDVASIEEAVRRRYKRLAMEGRSMPDLILIDGGRAQLNAALKGLSSLGMKNIPVVALAKKNETLYTSLSKAPVNLGLGAPALRLLMRIRNETHRFANKSHIQRRDKEELKTALLRLKGIGPKKASLLLRRFDSLKDIKEASVERLCSEGLTKRDYLSLKSLSKGTIIHGKEKPPPSG